MSHPHFIPTDATEISKTDTFTGWLSADAKDVWIVMNDRESDTSEYAITSTISTLLERSANSPNLDRLFVADRKRIGGLPPSQKEPMEVGAFVCHGCTVFVFDFDAA